MRRVIIIPALNEAEAIGDVVRGAAAHADEVILADNGSIDATARIARRAGATVVSEPQAGYGRACLAGVAKAGHADILIFMDGDGADRPQDIPRLIAPIIEGGMDFVVGSRALGTPETGALTLPQRWGNFLACRLMAWLWGGRYTDLGPMRAIRKTAYDQLAMSAPTFGWTVEMQVRALKAGLKYVEIPVNYRARIGTSKISGTVKGVVLAGA
ncbi:MAG: glycosyltransferase family 2 protein, partial [Pseudomonadota bacterium]